MRLRLLALVSALNLIGCPASPGDSSAGDAVQPPPKAAASPDLGWDGEYRGEQMTVVVKLGDDGRVGGTIERGGKTFTLSGGRPEGGRASGRFETEGTQFDLELRRDRDEMQLETGGATYVMTRYTPPNPLAKANPLAKVDPQPQGKAPVAEPAAPAPRAGWKELTDPSGFRMEHPADWQVQRAAEAGLIFVPPGQAKDPQGQPLEIYIGREAPATGLTRSDEPGAVQQLNQMVRADFPFLSPQGAPESLTCAGGPGAILAYAGVNPRGRSIEARVHALVASGKALILFGVGEKEHLEKRLDTLRAMFETFELKSAAAGQPAKGGASAAGVDPRLAGYWRHTKTYMSGGFSVVTDEHLVLQSDGRCFWNSKTAGGMQHTDSGGGYAGDSSFHTDGQGWSYQGTWSVQGSTLTMRWTSHGESEVQNFYVEGDSMMFKGSKPKLWKLIRR